jgi:PAS domain S-box-containing protein
MFDPSEILNASILIVDDQEASVRLIAQMLGDAGYTNISTSTDPLTVRALHEENQYDLILLELQMSKMDGFQVMESLKEVEGDGYLSVLTITDPPAHVLRALKAGAKDFVSKPFDLPEMQTRVRNLLEVRLLHRKLCKFNETLERTVLEKTAALRDSEARFKSFTELSSDWYWEQDETGKFTKISGPVYEMLGIVRDDSSSTGGKKFSGEWDADERALLDANIAARRPFLDFVYSRKNADGSKQYLQVSGEPMFDPSSRFVGYRGIGMDITGRMNRQK